ncbi:hypothetical protein IscW_ISCW008418 [Ixodes scapularis]|uniref:Secreted protein n=1 Tax=Ixodes scapularis TaxID=6945 RepID=B7PX49_IXOSC|nr:hypothetical protein IscW_ISCW008418 [Ixodes scapularis]|eukprot:XP_002410515.1 hypothetical protein IscW_ISCW008418 [Ixodes scapularis]
MTFALLLVVGLLLAHGVAGAIPYPDHENNDIDDLVNTVRAVSIFCFACFTLACLILLFEMDCVLPRRRRRLGRKPRFRRPLFSSRFKVHEIECSLRFIYEVPDKAACHKTTC